ncbi:hypothetical protein LOK49_Contig124G00010 [Camellia lanceoleosa]|nr:hypothetical protein LOK49_Contig124G00010 [Camellia lanceoleosa]
MDKRRWLTGGKPSRRKALLKQMGVQGGGKWPGSEWLHRSIIVRLKDMSLLRDLQKILLQANVQGIVRIGGGNLIVLTLQSIEGVIQNFSKIAVMIQEMCDEIRTWNEDVNTEPSPLVWLNFYGIPLNVWNESTFTRIGSIWGEILQLDDDTKELMSFDCGKVLISTKVMEKNSGAEDAMAMELERSVAEIARTSEKNRVQVAVEVDHEEEVDQ